MTNVNFRLSINSATNHKGSDMLKAVLHGKARRVEQQDNSSVSWRQLFKTHEDLMTAAIFGRFSYLSANIQSRLLQTWLKCGDDFSDFKDIEFWPTYSLNSGNTNCLVEPDLILRFEHCNIIVEVKPPAGGNQYFEQWQREIHSFLQAEGDIEKPLYFLALGRINKNDANNWAKLLIDTCNDNAPSNSSSNLIKVAALKWQEIADNFIDLTRQATTHNPDLRIMNDIIEVLKLYNLKTAQFKWPSLINTGSAQSAENRNNINDKTNQLNTSSLEKISLWKIPQK